MSNTKLIILPLVRTLAIATIASQLVACKSTNPQNATNSPSIRKTQLIEAQPPQASVAALSFMAGRWANLNQSGGVAEEMWMPPRGDGMTGAFRQVNRDGMTAFHEIAAITADPATATAPATVYLRLRHFHAKLDLQGKESEEQVYKLTSVQANRATFSAVSNTRGVASVSYQRTHDSMRVEITFNPGGPRAKDIIDLVLLAD